MPQAPDYLRAIFSDDRAAWDVLKDNFTDDRGLIRPKPGHVAVPEELHAVDYLILEWDYGYENPEGAGTCDDGHPAGGLILGQVDAEAHPRTGAGSTPALPTMTSQQMRATANDALYWIVEIMRGTGPDTRYTQAVMEKARTHIQRVAILLHDAIDAAEGRGISGMNPANSPQNPASTEGG